MNRQHVGYVGVVAAYAMIGILALIVAYSMGDDNGYRVGWDQGYAAGQRGNRSSSAWHLGPSAASFAYSEGATNRASMQLPELAPGESVRRSARVTTFTADQGPTIVEPGRIQADCYLRYCRAANGVWEECAGEVPTQEKTP